VRLPKPLIEQAGLFEEVELSVRDGSIVIARADAPRAGWAEAARKIRERDEDTMLAPHLPTRFDQKEWEW